MLDAGRLDRFASDRRQGRQQRRPSERNFALAAELLGSQLELRVLSVYDLDPHKFGEFDLVVMGYVLKMLRDPIRALESVRGVCRGQLILLDTVSWPLKLLRAPLARLDARRDGSEWFVFNRRGLRKASELAGSVVEKTMPVLHDHAGPAPADASARSAAPSTPSAFADAAPRSEPDRWIRAGRRPGRLVIDRPPFVGCRPPSGTLGCRLTGGVCPRGLALTNAASYRRLADARARSQDPWRALVGGVRQAREHVGRGQWDRASRHGLAAVHQPVGVAVVRAADPRGDDCRLQARPGATGRVHGSGPLAIDYDVTEVNTDLGPGHGGGGRATAGADPPLRAANREAGNRALLQSHRPLAVPAQAYRPPARAALRRLVAMSVPVLRWVRRTWTNDERAGSADGGRPTVSTSPSPLRTPRPPARSASPPPEHKSRIWPRWLYVRYSPVEAAPAPRADVVATHVTSDYSFVRPPVPPHTVLERHQHDDGQRRQPGSVPGVARPVTASDTRPASSDVRARPSPSPTQRAWQQRFVE